MIERIAEAMGVGRLPLGFGLSLTSPASAVVSAVTEQPLELVRPLMQSLEHDLLPRDASEAAAMYGIRTLPFERAVDRALARVGAHRGAGREMKVEREIEIAAPPQDLYEVVMDSSRLEDWVTIHERLEGSPARPSSEGLEADPVPEARRPEVQGPLDGGGERPVPPRGVGGPRPGSLARERGLRVRARTARGTRFSYSNEYKLPGGPLGNMAGPMVRRITAGEVDRSLERLKGLVE